MEYVIRNIIPLPINVDLYDYKDIVRLRQAIRSDAVMHKRYSYPLRNAVAQYQEYGLDTFKLRTW